MSLRRLYIASIILFIGTLLIFIKDLPQSEDHLASETVLLLQNEQMIVVANIDELEENKINYKIHYECYLKEESRYLLIVQQLPSPIVLDLSIIPKECKYDNEMTITCIYEEKAINYLEKDIALALYYDENYLTSYVSKVTGHIKTDRKISRGIEKWIEGIKSQKP